MRTILRPGWLVDGTGALAKTGQAVVVAGSLIVQVGPAAAMEAQAGDRIIDLDGMTLIPGLINNHVHLVLPGDNTPFTPWIDTQSDASLALWAASNALKALHAGVTTVRDCGGRNTVVIDVRDTQTAGRISGARIIACGWTLTIAGGHTRHFGGEADGETALRQMVRRVVSHGANYVKVMASGGGTPGSLAQYPSFSVPELQAIVDTAHGLGRLVSAHCTNAQAILNAVEARVDLIEHAMFFGEDLRSHYEPVVGERLAASGIAVTPTLQVDRDMVRVLPDGPERSLWRQRNQVHREVVHRLYELGVPLLAGSDAGWRATGFDTFWQELDELVACGLSPVEAIHAATGAASRALGYADQFGTIQSGQIADLVVVDGDLASDIRYLDKVRAVFQAGQAVV